ncbi:MAG TPA: signal peptide peptidase SppA [Bryobacteraceae bacterium]|nr:signal peptide peptidase SppA [Bryobacteraceae bacterium]
MAKFLLGVLVGVVVAIVGAFIIVLAIGHLFANKQPTIAANSVLVLSLDGDLPEAAPVDLPIPFIQNQSMPTVRDVWSSLRQAATDNRIKAVVIQPRHLVTGWGILEEVRQDLAAFKRSGKPVYAMLNSPGSREYYLASVADKIFMSPEDLLDVKGFHLEELFFKNTLDKLGIAVQVDHIGRYKDAGDIFTRTDMSPETREVLNQVLDQVYGDFCSTIGAARHKSADDIKALIDMGPFLAPQAKASGLIDELGYEDQVYAELKNKVAAGELNKVNIRSYFHAVPARGDRIALLVGQGDIVSGDADNSIGSEAVIASGTFSKLVREVRNDRSIKGVILRIDSPGGDAIASDEILHELKLLSGAKPLVISMSDVAASGGYYVSMTGDPVLSYPDTITGSIGVLYVRPSLHGLYDKLGISDDMVTRGKLADMDSLYLPLSDAARAKLHDLIEATYVAFVSKVSTARKKSYDQIDPIAQGRVWMGVQALQNGLVDHLGGLDQAIALVRKRAHLSETGDTNLVMYPPRRSLFDVLANVSADGMAASGAETKLRKVLPGLPSEAFLRGGLLRIMPYRLTIH